MKKTVLFSGPVVLAFLLAACGGSSSTPEPVSFDVHMTEYSFQPSTIKVKVGQQVTLNLINDGQLSHEIMFGRDVVTTDNRPTGFQTDMFEAAGVEPTVTSSGGSEMDHHEAGYSGVMVVLQNTGDKATMTFTATKEMVGDWEMGCFEQDGVHYQAGMKGTFTVSQ